MKQTIYTQILKQFENNLLILIVLNGVEHKINDGSAVLVPAGAMHNIINTSSEKPLKLYTIYSPPEHRDRIIHATKEEAVADDEHFDGKTTE